MVTIVLPEYTDINGLALTFDDPVFNYFSNF
jgi:hypothetical protein